MIPEVIPESSNIRGSVSLIKSAEAELSKKKELQKGGDPAAPSDTATLLRLRPNHRPYLRRLLPCG